MIELFNKLGKEGLKIAYTLLSDFALYLTLAIAVILGITALILNFKAKQKLAKFKSICFGIVIGYAVTLTVCISFFMVARLIIKDEIDTNFYLMLAFFGLCLVYAISAMITAMLNKKAFKICNAIGISLLVIYAIVLLNILPTAGEEYQPLSVAGMYVFSFLLVAVIALLAILFGKDKGSASPTKSVAFAGVSIALSFALSYIKLFSLPQGGSVTLASALPLIIYSYVFGARKGVFAGIIYGVLQCLQSPQIYQPMQVIIDYPIAFATIGLAGITTNFKFLKKPLWQFMVGASISLLLRYVAHFLSGYYVFSSWAMAGYTALTWSLVYNLYILVDLAIVLFVGAFIFSSKPVMRQLDGLNPKL